MEYKKHSLCSEFGSRQACTLNWVYTIQHGSKSQKNTTLGLRRWDGRRGRRRSWLSSGRPSSGGSVGSKVRSHIRAELFIVERGHLVDGWAEEVVLPIHQL